MRVLWFVNSRITVNEDIVIFSESWISALYNSICNLDDLSLGICTFSDSTTTTSTGNTSVYTIVKPRGLIRQIKQLILPSDKAAKVNEATVIPMLQQVVESFKPDIIHVFGTENTFGLISSFTDIPVVIHIQGLLSAIKNFYLPSEVTWNKLIFSNLNPKSILIGLAEKVTWQRNSLTEQKIIRSCKYFMGRTEWDRRVVKLLNPNACYFHCDELMRPEFFEPLQRHQPDATNPKFVTTISYQLYKGFDVILKTAQLFKQYFGDNFEWIIIGDTSPRFMEKITGIKAADYNKKFAGRCTPQEIKEIMVNATAYIHPSYIENSSNAICEAQLLGVPVIASNVGGTATLIKDHVSGLLFPSNHLFILASLMKEIAQSPALQFSLSKNARDIALRRHDESRIVETLSTIYQSIIERSKATNNT